jgi:penicillin-binding protein 1C
VNPTVSAFRASYFFCFAKKSNQKKATPAIGLILRCSEKSGTEKTRFAQTVFCSDRFFPPLLGANQRGPLPTFRAKVALMTALFSTLSFASAPTSFDTIRSTYTPSDRLILDRNGATIQRVRVDDKVRRGAWTALDDISPALIDAVLASEDKRFFEHGGVDLRAAAAALASNVRGGTVTRGASSISMQVAASMDKSLARASDGRTVAQKLDQAQAAWALERSWSKQQILETYLNSIFFRGEIQGIGAASDVLFGKSPHGLNAAESALLAALIRAPQAPRATVERRACEVLKGLDAKGDCGELAFAMDRWGGAAALRNADESIAPHVAKYLATKPCNTVETLCRSGLPRPDGIGSGEVAASRSYSTLDRDLQLAARDAIAKHLQQLSGRNAHDAAVVMIDNVTGEVLAYVGSSGRLSAAGEVDAARAPRQAGSTLKPFIYGLGLERNLFTAATLLDDAPFSVDVGGGAYTPQNYAHEYVGPVSVRTALASSLNVPAIRALTLVGVAPSHALLRRAGLTTLVDDPDHYGFSLALGSADVSLIELTNAYRAIANGGVSSAFSFACGSGATATGSCREGGRRGGAAPTNGGARLFSEPTAWIITDILADRGARYVTFGFDNPLALSHWAAVKTGTSKDMRDNWTIGFNTRVTVGVWVGNASGAPMHNITGITGAGPIWADVMEAAATKLGADRPGAAPANLLKKRIEFASADGRVEAGRDEWFLRGTEPASALIAARAASGVGARIVTPSDGTIIALDPDIPANHQRVQFKSGDAAQAGCWTVNDAPLGCSSDSLAWTPVAGNAVIKLMDADGKERDRVTVLVRGSLQRAGRDAMARLQ